MNRKQRRLILLALDILLIIMEIYALGVSWGESGAKLFRYYTQNSNVLGLIAACICLAQNIIGLKRKQSLPRWTRSLRYIAACCLTATLLISGCLMAPLDPDRSFAQFMLEGKYLYLHTLCPLVMIAQLYIHPGVAMKEKQALFSLIPTMIYIGVMLLLNAGGMVTGPYPFLEIHGQDAYVTTTGCISVLAANYTASRLLAAFTK